MGGRRNGTKSVYQIDVLDFGKPAERSSVRDATIPNRNGIYYCYKCGWEGEREAACPVCGNNIVPKGRVKLVDALPLAQQRTLITQSHSNKKAKRHGRRFGSVIRCRKVDMSVYTQNIEYLNLNQEPISLEIETEDLLLNEELEIELPQKKV